MINPFHASDDKIMHARIQKVLSEGVQLWQGFILFF